MVKYEEQARVSAKDALALWRAQGRRYKSRLVEELVALCGYSRKHAIGLLNERGGPRLLKRSGPKPVYPPKQVRLLRLCEMRRGDLQTHPRRASHSEAATGTLFNGGQCPGEPLFATAGCISMNDPALGSFIDCRGQQTNLISAVRLRGMHSLLHCP